MEVSYSFDDVLIIPQYSEISSRYDVDLKVNFCGTTLNVPVICSPMDRISSYEMCTELYRCGGLGILHRFMPEDEFVKTSLRIKEACHQTLYIAIGLDIDFSLLEKILPYGVCIDVAHGDSLKVINLIKLLRKNFTNMNIMAGSVATSEGALRLVEAGATSIRCGIGGGSVCTTRQNTGCGIPTFQSIVDIFNAFRDKDIFYTVPIIADGGLRFVGDICKAIGAGATAVMLGGMLAGCTECPGKIHNINGRQYKEYRGMASKSIQIERNANRLPRIEGVEALVPIKGNVSNIIQSIKNGLQSCLSYTGYHSIDEFIGGAVFTSVTQNGVIENSAHINGIIKYE